MQAREGYVVYEGLQLFIIPLLPVTNSGDDDDIDDTGDYDDNIS